MIESEPSTILNILPQQLDKGPVGGRPKTLRVHGRQAPVLTFRGKGIWRRAAIGL
jgi:hypothetical protein